MRLLSSRRIVDWTQLPGESLAALEANTLTQVEEQVGPRELVVFNTDELVAMDPGIRAPGGQNQSDELVPGSNLALYGRGDHLQEAPLTLVERQQMVLRWAHCSSSQQPEHISHHVQLQVCVHSFSRPPQCRA